jgi:protein-disulfide isomerase
MNKKFLFISSAVVLVIVFISAIAVFKNEQAVNSAVPKEDVSALKRINAPFKGASDAKVTIVEFFDPACETCRQFYPLVNDILKKHDGKVKLVMRYAPLHQGSDVVVKMLEAAHMQGQFWPASELLLATQQRWVNHHVSQPEKALTLLKTLPLDHAKLVADSNHIKTASIIKRDINDGKTLKVRATPQFFVNGKPLINFGYKPLVKLVEDAIEEAY